jgi:hypothetical protein
VGVLKSQAAREEPNLQELWIPQILLATSCPFAQSLAGQCGDAAAMAISTFLQRQINRLARVRHHHHCEFSFISSDAAQCPLTGFKLSIGFHVPLPKTLHTVSHGNVGSN